VPDDVPLYRETCEALILDPLAEITDDHQVQPVDPGWFLTLDDVDSRLVRDAGAPA
jgi:hypothetical protein